MHISQAKISALEAECEFGVVEAEEVHNGGVEVVHVDSIGDGVEAEFVGFADRGSWLDAASREPHGKGVGVMIATVVASLNHRGASEFTSPDDEGVFKQAALLEVAK